MFDCIKKNVFVIFLMVCIVELPNFVLFCSIMSKYACYINYVKLLSWYRWELVKLWIDFSFFQINFRMTIIRLGL